ncbi:hypothetical protein CHGG_01204 [Chaetomium globosum CBS 148.51]|uniref:RRM domain-containing protein n=1 Tax=Chaetomium globosum (strain ATCC 6205 / CBS 148.51 / DSM 1962 / NBRC 6347 / NRRL 1970) TaxID=306901 RepID=Q2HF00_CHAGB|nr:uncharacterized protein CHGG_01204 [Chaetomium globosum CBS 148.51]EAQ92969.1 hypothetical protein CHGG_01204 [Chaetomium globosum CBS 148.51]
MAEYTATGPPGAATNGSNINGNGDANFAPPAPMPSSNEAAKTLWMGEMEGWMDETFIKNICRTVLGEDVQVKVIRDRNSGDDRGPEYSIFVGDLGPEVNEFVLVSLFQSRFPSCKSAKIMTDAMTGQSRGYGFVRFSDESDQQRALVEMQGVYCGNRPMRISTATPKTRMAVTAKPRPKVATR